ncbi:MAG TPA: CoA pyrophosphatase [Steroidobacteraceae bacterium]|nr:CoA pyrophosphatase [Steroidobacteraceae bacterium]
MQDAGADSGAGGRQSRAIDWRSRISARLAHTRPQHDPADWLIPGLDQRASRHYLSLFPHDPIPAAVLIPLVERQHELTVLLTQRASQLKNHAGQISFPGGRIEAADAGPREAALREAHEEIGLEERLVSVVGYLPDHVLVSGFRVTPVVAFVQPGFELLLDAQEVADTFEVPLSHVFEPANHRSRRRRFGADQQDIEVWDIPYEGRNIWGATAGMLLNLYRLCGADPPQQAPGPDG